MYCSECGNEIDETDKFCINCGQKNKTLTKNKSEINNSNFQFECSTCGENISIDDDYCPNCSEEFIEIDDDEDNYYNSNQENTNNSKVEINNSDFQFECNNCGVEVSIDDDYCPNCSEDIREIIEDEDNFYNSNQKKKNNPKVIAVPNPGGTKNSYFWTFIKIICTIIIILLIFSIVQNPFYQNLFTNNKESTSVPEVYLTQTKSTSEYNSEPAPEVISYITPAVQIDKNIQIIEQIAEEYYSTHTYQGDDVFDCDNMAQDVWNMLKTKGINSKLVLGNVDHFGPLSLDDVNHVWLIAEISPEEWLAIETTGGFIVYSDDNDRYYNGYFFSNPKNYRDFLDLYNDYNYQYADYENERQYYNQLVEIYNSANYYEQIQLESALIVTKNNVEIKERRASETRIQMETILEYG